MAAPAIQMAGGCGDLQLLSMGVMLLMEAVAVDRAEGASMLADAVGAMSDTEREGVVVAAADLDRRVTALLQEHLISGPVAESD